MSAPYPFQACVAVKIRKISENNESLEAGWEDGACHPITKGYWVGGFLVEPVEVGMPVKLFRIVRNNIVALGRF
jgi:hypothetical protein